MLCYRWIQDDLAHDTEIWMQRESMSVILKIHDSKKARQKHRMNPEYRVLKHLKKMSIQKTTKSPQTMHSELQWWMAKVSLLWKIMSFFSHACYTYNAILSCKFTNYFTPTIHLHTHICTRAHTHTFTLSPTIARVYKFSISVPERGVWGVFTKSWSCYTL